jgi:hypothetical protein
MRKIGNAAECVAIKLRDITAVADEARRKAPPQIELALAKRR